MWCREKQIDSKDRTYHEMRTLVDCIYFAAVYDQLNIGALASLEVISRRVHAIVDAYAAGPRPQWTLAKHLTGATAAEDVVSAELRTYAAKLAREESEMYSARMKFGKKKFGGVSDDEDAGDAKGGAGEASGGGEKPKTRRGGRGQGKLGAAEKP